MEFDPNLSSNAYARQEATAERDICQCPECVNNLLQLDDWEDASQETWKVTRSCPNCEWEGTDIMTIDEVDALEESQEMGKLQLVRTIAQVTRSNMQEESETFAKALQMDAILPEDF